MLIYGFQHCCAVSNCSKPKLLNTNTPAGGKRHPSKIMSYKYSFCFYYLQQINEIFELVCYPGDMEAFHQYIQDLTVI